MKIQFFDYKRELAKIRFEINSAINRVLDSGMLILGKEVDTFENNFSKYIGQKYGIGVNSGTDALKIAMKAIGLKAGDEVITVANTAVPTISSIRELGAIPKFVDIKSDYLIDEKKVEVAITNKTKLILAVHLYGQPCNIKKLIDIAKKNNLKIIEDCAQANGAMLKNKKVGSFTDISCFSFYPTKTIGAYGDAGIILTSNRRIANKCRQLRMYGMKRTYFAEIEGYNSRMDEIQAAILNVKLKYLNKWKSRRQTIAKFYLENIKNQKIILPEIHDIKEHVFHLFVIRTKNRKSLIDYLARHGICTMIHYPYPIHLQTAYKFLGVKKGSLPITEHFAKEILDIPLFPELKKEEIKYIVEILNKF